MRELDQFRTKPADARVAPPIVQDVLQSQGKPLEAEIRRSMEPHFGHDFGHVRVHTDERAAASAGAVDARAYAAGSNIVFARGQFSPDTKPGRQLLAHELAHTVQQRNSGPAAGAPPISDPGSHAESEADGAAKAVAANRAASVTSSAPVIARQPAGSDTKEKAAEPTNLEQVEQALTKFFKDVKSAFPNDSLPQNSRVITEVLRIAGASRAPERVGPVKTVSPAEVQAKMRDFLKDILAPKDPEGLAKAVVRRLPGPVDPAEIDHLKSLDVLKPDQPKGIPGVVDRYQKLAPADLPPKDPQAVSDQQKQDAAMATQRSNPTLSPPLDPWRVGKAIAGGKDQAPDHSEHQYPPVPKPDEPYRPGVVNKDIKIASTLPSLTVDRAIHFQVNQPGAVAPDDKSLKASLTPGGVGDLDLVVRWLQRGPEFGVELTGMASIEGPPEHNKELGENRARSVASALLRAGIGAAQIDDVPGKPNACPQLSFGIYNCGDSQAAKPANPNDRRVNARLFVRPKSNKP